MDNSHKAANAKTGLHTKILQMIALFIKLYNIPYQTKKTTNPQLF